MTLSQFLSGSKVPDFLAGLTGGAVSTLILHPLDLAKIRLQVNEGTGAVKYRPKTRSTIGTLAEVVQLRGFRGLYLGLVPNVIGASGSWGLYFLLYAALKSYVQEGDGTKALPALHYFGCGAVAGSVTLTIMNPIWVIKTRLCLQYERLTQASQVPSKIACGQFSSVGLWSALVQLWRHEGVAGFYRGYLPGLFGVSHGAIQFMLYDRMRDMYNASYRKQVVNTKLSAVEYLVLSSVSKIAASLLTYPYQVVRSRLQDQHRQYSGVLHVIRVLWIGEGLVGFYKGVVPNLLRVTPACAITFVLYECTLDLWRSLFTS
ncbi:unnamed protein product [Dicrocoelium dendriticum]|nr:unnamed protein product [Dicrocoelium dendriticum]